MFPIKGVYSDFRNIRLFPKQFQYRFILKFLFSFLFFFLISLSTNSQKIYWADVTSDKIQLSNLDGNNIVDVLSGLSDPRGIAIDHINGHLYYTDDGNNKIVRIDLDGSNPVVLVSSGTTPYSIELDIPRGKMYWSDISKDVIKRANIDGSNVETIVDLTTDNIYGFALDLINDKIYIAQNTSGIISKSNLDGTNKTNIISSGLSQPNGIVLDVENNFMYWTETDGDLIRRANLNGENITDLVAGLNSPRQIRIDYINQKLFWTDVNEDKIQTSNLDGTGISDVIISLGSAYSIFLYDVGEDSKAEVSGNWSTSSNWSQGVPNATTSNADIAGNIIVNGNYTVKNLGIRSGGTLTIKSGNTLTVSGNITNAAGANGLVIQSDASNTGSLIVSGSNSSEDVTIERYMYGASTGWHLIGVPVIGQSVNEMATSASNSISTSNNQYGLGFYDESIDTWTTYTSSTAPGAASLIPGMGYEINRSVDGDLDFVGTLSSTQVDISVTRDRSGWNVVGNPYPCALYANSAADGTNNFITINSAALDDSFEAIYIWNASSSEYEVINQSSGATYIPSGQGFFIKSKVGGGTISFTPAMRVHQTGSSFKSTDLFQPKITLTIDDGFNQNSTQIKFIDGCSLGLDPGYDAGMYHGIKSDLELYTRIENDSIAYDLQCLPNISNQDFIIPIEIESKNNHAIRFSLQIEDFPEGYHVYLEDKNKASLTKLGALGEEYKANISNAISQDRFYLKVSKRDLLEQNININQQDLKIITDYNSGLIRIEGLYNSTAQIQIHDISGRIILSQEINGNIVNASQLKPGIYLVSIIENGIRRTEKINWIK